MTTRFFLYTLLATMAGAAPSLHAEAANPGACRYVPVATLPLNYAGTGLDITVQGSINGVPATMLADTGAMSSSLTREAADKLHLAMQPSGRYHHGVGGATPVYDTLVKELSVGPTRGEKMTMQIARDTGAQAQYDAIVGADFLLQTDMELSLAEKQMKFYRAHDCRDTFLAYWDRDAMELPTTRSGDRVNPHFQIQLNGKPYTAMLDSGAFRTVVFADAAKRAGIDLTTLLRAGTAYGIGAEQVQRYSATFDTFGIGSETIKNARINVIASDSVSGVDILLGQDFLRAHRVLFAQSQDRIYLSYVGGDVFGKAPGEIEPWMLKEAEGGNPDAQFRVGQMYLAAPAEKRDSKAGLSWLSKAAAQGQGEANAALAYRSLQAGQYTQAATQFERFLDKSPAQRRARLGLFLARTGAGEKELARQELAKAFAASASQSWPAPVADYFLGRLDADALLAKAQAGTPQRCDALGQIAQYQGILGDKAREKSLRDSMRTECKRDAS